MRRAPAVVITVTAATFLLVGLGIAARPHHLPPSTPGASTGTHPCHARDVKAPDGWLPDRTCTPGVINPQVTQANIATTICRTGWTATIRPPVAYTSKLKAVGIKAYGYTDTQFADYEEDHQLPLELGGSPTDPRNLWPEPHASPNEKDGEERALNRAVCRGAMPLATAQARIAANWTTAGP